MIETPGAPTIYVAGDTNAFGDMQLIGRIYAPDVAILPIGDHFTMGPREAAVAAELIGARRIVASHYATFPLLTGTPDALRELLPPASSCSRRPRAKPSRCDPARALVRQHRSEGPDLVLEGTLDVSEALVLDDVRDVAALRAAHARGTPIVVRASSLEEVTSALARPEVACVLVTDEALLTVDLADVTYG